MEKMKKWLSNYWYHYKFRTILCLFFAFILVFTVAQCATNEKYDTHIYLYLSENLSSDVERSFDLTFEEYLNKGKKEEEKQNIGIINLSYDPYNNDSNNHHSSAFLAEIKLKNHFLIVTDDYRLEELTEKPALKGALQKYDGFNAFDGVAYSIKGTKFEQKLKKQFAENGINSANIPTLYISLLTPPEKDSAGYEAYKKAVQLIETILSE